MSSPVDTPSNPFRDPPEMTESPRDLHDMARAVISSADASQPGSAGGKRASKKRVGFTGHGSGDASPRINVSGQGSGNDTPRLLTPPSHLSPDISGQSTPNHSRRGSEDFMLPSSSSSKSHLPELSPQQTQEIHEAFSQSLNVPTLARPRPAIRRTASGQSAVVIEDGDVEGPEDDPQRAHRQARAREAYLRGKRLETDERIRSEPGSRYASPERPPKIRTHAPDGTSIPLQILTPKYDGGDNDIAVEDDSPGLDGGRKSLNAEAHKLVRKHTVQIGGSFHHDDPNSPGLRSGAVTPTEEQGFMEDYRPRPDQYRGGILGSLLKLYGQSSSGHQHRGSNGQRGSHSRQSSMELLGGSGGNSGYSTPQHSPPESGSVTPVSHWYNYKKNKSQSTTSLAQLIGSSASLGSPAVVSGLGEQVTQRLKEQKEAAERAKRPVLGKRSHSANAARAALNRFSRPRLEEEIRITVHIAETIARQRYLMKLCRALMVYGAPTHRLEEYMNMSARVLEIQAQFLYIPGSMIMSFDDPATHTTEVKLVRAVHGLDLGKLRDVHEVYKDVVHDRVGVEEATARLKEVTEKKAKHSRWVRIPVYGLAAVCVGPFAFEARLIDLPIAFILGCMLGVLQLVIAPRSDLYANVFEVSATIITSFLSRAFGSIPDGNGGRMFCFSSLAQSSIALILPGYMVLCASLELQSRAMVAGSVRMVYAIIYTLFLGFGITIGTALYGVMDGNATSATTCTDSIPSHWGFIFVPGFALCLCIINQAKWKQTPVMIFIAFAGYIVSYFSSKRFSGNTQVSSALGALAIGVCANMYSRVGARAENWLWDLWEDRLRHHWKRQKRRYFTIKAKTHDMTHTHGDKALEEQQPASASSDSRPTSSSTTAAHDAESLYVRQTRRVGYGLAAAAMLPAIFVLVPSGLAVSGSLISGIASADQIVGNGTNGTTTVSSGSSSSTTSGINSITFDVAYSVIQVAIGITVGLFLSAIVVYPLGKRRSGLFSF